MLTHRKAFSKEFVLTFACKAIHAELSKLVKRQSGGKDAQEWRAKPAEVLGDNITPFVVPSKKKPTVSNNSSM